MNTIGISLIVFILGYIIIAICNAVTVVVFGATNITVYDELACAILYSCAVISYFLVKLINLLKESNKKN